MNNVEYEINSFLAVALFPRLTKMLAYENRIDVVYEDLGYDCSSYPYTTEELHTLEDYKNISDIIENNYEKEKEASYTSGSGFSVSTINYGIYTEIESVYYELIKKILTHNISMESDKKEMFIF